MKDRAGEQRWDPEAYERNGRFVSTHGRDVLNLLMARRGERIMDLGCGDGVLTAEIAKIGAQVVGVDSSQAFVNAAKARKIDVRQLDATELSFENEFDAAFSNAALHWMQPLSAVLAGVRRSLRPRGRFVGELGGFGNCAAIVATTRAILNERDISYVEPWTFPTAETFSQLLEAARFRVDSISLIPRATSLPTGMRPWLETFAQPMFAEVPAADRDVVLERIVAALAPSLRNEGGSWTADYVRLRFHATAS